ncbi:MAG: glycosyltransferase [Patescibacteria group bacterium]
MKFSQKPKIIIACPSTVGNQPTYYASELGKHLPARVFVFSLRLPTILRHVWFAIRIMFSGAEWVIALDNFSVALSTVLSGKKVVMRVGGDFLWESHVNGTNNPVLLSDFYQKIKSGEIKLNKKEKLVKILTQFLYKRADKIVFSTEWQKRITNQGYELIDSKISIVVNHIGPKKESTFAKHKKFLCIARNVPLKNLSKLESAFIMAKKEQPDIELEICKNIPQEKVWGKLADCYAFILPSISEVSPNLVLQALQYNKPVIATKDCGFADSLADTVMLTNPMDEKDIRDKIIEMSRENVSKEYTEKARKFNHVHTYADIAREFMRVIAKI